MPLAGNTDKTLHSRRPHIIIYISYTVIIKSSIFPIRVLLAILSREPAISETKDSSLHNFYPVICAVISEKGNVVEACMIC